MVQRLKTEFVGAAYGLEEQWAVVHRLIDEIRSADISQARAADLIRVAARRNQLLCNSWRLVERPDGGTSASKAIEDALQSKQTMLSTAADALATNGTLPVESLTTFDGAPWTLMQLAPLVEFADANGISLPPAHPTLSTNSDILAVTLSLGSGWITTRNDTKINLLAPADFQQDEKLGPAVWNLGTGSKVVRVRNGSDWNIDTAISIGQALLGLTSAPTGREATALGDGKTGERVTFEPAGSNWRFIVDVVIDTDFTYFLETGCPASIEQCGDLADMVASGATIH